MPQHRGIAFVLQAGWYWLVQLEARPSQAANDIDFMSDVRGFTRKVKGRLPNRSVPQDGVPQDADGGIMQGSPGL